MPIKGLTQPKTNLNPNLKDKWIFDKFRIKPWTDFRYNFAPTLSQPAINHWPNPESTPNQTERKLKHILNQTLSTPEITPEKW